MIILLKYLKNANRLRGWAIVKKELVRMTMAKNVLTAAAIATIISTAIGVYSIFKTEDGIAQSKIVEEVVEIERSADVVVTPIETNSENSGSEIDCSPIQGHHSNAICGDVNVVNGDVNIGGPRN